MGGVAPAGSEIGYDTEFVGVAQFPVPADADAAVTVVAVTGSVFDAALVKVVDVPVMFQPAWLPVSSSGVKRAVVDRVWFWPFREAAVNETAPGLVSARLPPPQVVK